MASKSELLEAQGFSRRRLLTAFVSGAPGGRELEPARPMRAVYIGIALSVAVLLVSLFVRYLNPGLPDGWDNGRLVVDISTGSRYITVDGTLHPVLNIASARLLLPEGATVKPLNASTAQLSDSPIGQTLGIAGAPDTLPESTALISSGWTACIADENGSIDARVARTPDATAPADDTEAVLVSVDGRSWIIAGERRFELPDDVSDGLLRDIGLGGVTARTATHDWLNLFQPGDPVTPQRVADAGARVAGTDLRIGDVVTGAQGAEDRYVVVDGGTLAHLSPFAFALYQHSDGFSQKRVRTDVDSSTIADMKNAPESASMEGADWPERSFTAASSATAPCAITATSADHSITRLALANPDATLTPGTRVDVGSGALVEVAGFGADGANVLVLVDATATTYQVTDASDATIAKLGFSRDDIGAAGVGWMALFEGGPELSPEAAGAAKIATDEPAS